MHLLQLASSSGCNLYSLSARCSTQRSGRPGQLFVSMVTGFNVGRLGSLGLHWPSEQAGSFAAHQERGCFVSLLYMQAPGVSLWWPPK